MERCIAEAPLAFVVDEAAAATDEVPDPIRLLADDGVFDVPEADEFDEVVVALLVAFSKSMCAALLIVGTTLEVLELVEDWVVVTEVLLEVELVVEVEELELVELEEVEDGGGGEDEDGDGLDSAGGDEDDEDPELELDSDPPAVSKTSITALTPFGAVTTQNAAPPAPMVFDPAISLKVLRLGSMAQGIPLQPSQLMLRPQLGIVSWKLDSGSS